MDFFCGEHGDPADKKNVKWSNCTWTNSLHYKVKPLTSKPGPSDVAIVRHGGHVLTVDVNPVVKGITVGDSSTLIAEKRTIKVSNAFRMPITRKGQVTLADLKDCNVEVKGPLDFTLWHKYTNAGMAELKLDNTKMIVKGDLNTVLPINPQYNCDSKAGFEINLIGASVLDFGGALIDNIVKDDPAHWFIRFKFTVDGAQVPALKFSRDAILPSAELEFNIKGDLKPGVYPLAEFDDKKSGFIKPRSVKFNGKAYTFGDFVQVGKYSARVTVAAAPKSKDVKTENDLVLEVKQ